MLVIVPTCPTVSACRHTRYTAQGTSILVAVNAHYSGQCVEGQGYIGSPAARKAAEVVYMMGKGNGGFSGGTIISLLDAFFAEPKEEVEACAHPYVLVPPGYPHGADNPDCWCVFFLPRQS